MEPVPVIEETKMESESAVTDDAGQVPCGNDKAEAEVPPSSVETSVENVPLEAEGKSETVAEDEDDKTVETVEPINTGDPEPVEEKAPEDKVQQGPCQQDGEGSKASNDSATEEVKDLKGDVEAVKSPKVPDSEPMLGMEVDNKAPQSDKENESADIIADCASNSNDKLETEMQTPTTDVSEGNTGHSEVREEDKDQANSSNDNMLESMVVSELTTCESLEMDVDEESEVLKTVEGDEREDNEAKSHKVISSDQELESEVLKTKEDKELKSHKVISSDQDQELEELKTEEDDDTKDKEVKSPKVVSVDKGDEKPSVSINEIEEKTEAENRDNLLETPEDSTKIVECKEKKIDECAGMEEADEIVATIQETDSLMEVEETNVDTEEGKSRSTSKEKETSEVTKPTKKDEAMNQSTLIVEDEELKSADAIVDAKDVKRDDVIVTPEAQEKSTASEPSESPQEPQEKLVEEKKDPTEESNCMPEKKTDDEQKDEEDDIILIDDENTTAEESESKAEKLSDQEKSEPAAKKLRLSTEEKEESKMDTADDQDSTAADLNKATEKSEDVSKNDEDKPQSDKVVSEDEDVVLIENDPKPSGKDEEKGDEKTGVEKDKLVEKDDETPSVLEKEDKSEVKKDDSDEVMVVESEKSDSKKSPNDPKPDEKETIGTSGDKTDKPQKEDEKIEGKSETAKVDDSKDKAAAENENTGMFEEKETAPEETVPQVFGDSDEDVVMVDNYVTTDRKSASKPPSKTPPPVTTTANSATPSTEQKTAPPEKSEPAAKELSKPKSSTVSVECINAECKKDTRETAPAPAFVLNFFGIPKKTKKQRICLSCYDEVVQKYSVLGGAVLDQQPLLFCEMPRKNELVEISDSSEEEEDADVKLEAEKPLPADIIALVESELNDIVSSTFEKINISQQIDWTEQIMKQKIAYNTKLSDEINNELNELQRKVDRIHLKLYSKSRPRYQDLPPINIFEVDANRQSIIQQPIQANRQYSPQRPFVQTVQQQQQIQQKQASQVTLGTQASAVSPPKEEFTRPAVSVGQFYFAVKHKLLSNWAECQVVEAVTVADKSLYKVNFLYNQGVGNAPIKVVPAKYLAYRHSFNVKLPLGTRVIARFDAGTTQPTLNKSQQAKSNSFYPGIIAESFGKYNRNRYLIFFDDGYAQYVTHGDVRVVCEESKEVWLDIHPHSQEFIKKLSDELPLAETHGAGEGRSTYNHRMEGQMDLRQGN
ncbi:titin homolog isoform X2 [Aedes aegypti]|uniref:Histone methyltransferase Tudor domain-containing protein n=1 Tax=Aedes aegypti TaxID=7159 RepID=A0A6I8TUE9_AEDAE|nr:titin homolog isoform X2 [Aedes aegypti]